MFGVVKQRSFLSTVLLNFVVDEIIIGMTRRREWITKKDSKHR
jgi:hypothetical protein